MNVCISVANGDGFGGSTGGANRVKNNGGIQKNAQIVSSNNDG
jgi:hypothetical protein